MSDKKKSVVNIIEGIVVAVLILLIGGMLFLYFSFSETGAAPDIFGYTIYHTKAVNMQPDIPAGTAVIAKSSEIDAIKVGSVVLCRIGEDTVLTRVVQLVSENGELSYVVKFDTAPDNDTFRIPQENVLARAIWTNKILGGLLTFATSTFGIMLVIIIPSFVIIVFQVIRIINVKRVEEDAVSLDDLNEVMIRDDDEDGDADAFAEPEPRETRPVMKPMRLESEPAEKAPDEVSELKFGGGSDLPLFTYDHMAQAIDKPAAKSSLRFGDEKEAAPAKEERRQSLKFDIPKPEIKPEIKLEPEIKPEQPAVTVKPVSVSKSENEMRFSTLGEALRQLEEERSAAHRAEAASVPEPVPVVTEPVSETVTETVQETMVSTAEPVEPAAKTVPVVRAAKPVQVKPAPVRPKAKKSGASVSELMSMIDAEELKLK